MDPCPAGSTYQPDLLDQPSLLARGESSSNIHGPAGVPGLLAGDDGGDDASIEPAYDVHDGACQPKRETPTGSTNGFPGRICSGLDGIRRCSLPARHPDPPVAA